MIYDIPDPPDCLVSVFDCASRVWDRVPVHPDLWQHGTAIKPWRSLASQFGPIQDKECAQ